MVLFTLSGEEGLFSFLNWIGFFNFLVVPAFDLNSGVSLPPTVQSPSESIITMDLETLLGVLVAGGVGDC